MHKIRRKQKLVFSIATFACLCTLRAKDDSFVTCRISGQLGNNMNQVATTLAFAWNYNVDPYFPELNKKENNISYNRDHIFFRLNTLAPPRLVSNTYDEYADEGGWWDCKPIPFMCDLYISGDFFCWKHFHSFRERLCALFAPSDEILNTINKKYGEILSHPLTVSVHVRTYNKQCHDTITPFVGLEYYRKAFDLFTSDTLFVIFSDRINWCKQHFAAFKKKCVFIEGNDHIVDFFLMSMLKSHIIANSCYSWWAAYLNNRPDKIVVAPRRNEHTNFRENIYLPEWTVIEFNLNEPYPSDIHDYDAYSQSMDTQ